MRSRRPAPHRRARTPEPTFESRRDEERFAILIDRLRDERRAAALAANEAVIAFRTAKSGAVKEHNRGRIRAIVHQWGDDPAMLDVIRAMGWLLPDRKA